MEQIEKRRERARAYYQKTAEARRAWARAWYKANVDRKKENSKSYRERQKESKRRQEGLEQPTRDAPAACECCGAARAEWLVGYTLCYDHCHKTGKFRGWLCRKCNTGIGKLGDTLDGVQRAIKYLQENS